jgi:hypothetical protein
MPDLDKIRSDLGTVLEFLPEYKERVAVGDCDDCLYAEYVFPDNDDQQIDVQFSVYPLQGTLKGSVLKFSNTYTNMYKRAKIVVRTIRALEQLCHDHSIKAFVIGANENPALWKRFGFDWLDPLDEKLKAHLEGIHLGGSEESKDYHSPMYKLL